MIAVVDNDRGYKIPVLWLGRVADVRCRPELKEFVTALETDPRYVELRGLLDEAFGYITYTEGLIDEAELDAGHQEMEERIAAIARGEITQDELIERLNAIWEGRARP